MNDFSYVIHPRLRAGIVVQRRAPARLLEVVVDSEEGSSQISYGNHGYQRTMHVTVEEMARWRPVSTNAALAKGDVGNHRRAHGRHIDLGVTAVAYRAHMVDDCQRACWCCGRSGGRRVGVPTLRARLGSTWWRTRLFAGIAGSTAAAGRGSDAARRLPQGAGGAGHARYAGAVTEIQESASLDSEAYAAFFARESAENLLPAGARLGLAERAAMNYCSIYRPGSTCGSGHRHHGRRLGHRSKPQSRTSFASLLLARADRPQRRRSRKAVAGEIGQPDREHARPAHPRRVSCAPPWPPSWRATVTDGLIQQTPAASPRTLQRHQPEGVGRLAQITSPVVSGDGARVLHAGWRRTVAQSST